MTSSNENASPQKVKEQSDELRTKTNLYCHFRKNSGHGFERSPQRIRSNGSCKDSIEDSRYKIGIRRGG